MVLLSLSIEYEQHFLSATAKWDGCGREEEIEVARVSSCPAKQLDVLPNMFAPLKDNENDVNGPLDENSNDGEGNKDEYNYIVIMAL